MSHAKQSGLAAKLLILSCCLALTACGGGGSNSSAGSASNCNVNAASSPQSLSAPEVEAMIAKAEQAATALSSKATIAVTDRVGNVLGVYQMPGAGATVNLASGLSKFSGVPVQGLDGLNGTIPSTLAAIAKAITGAYLSSSGNAFSTRTASYIIQDHFPPTINNTPSGPLFGVQFSQLPCGDFVQRGVGVGPGPKRSPLGLAGDPGGFPIYKNGVVVGGIGVMSDGVYGLDLNPTSGATDSDERIAQSALVGYEAPACIRANRITLGGTLASYSNADEQLVSVNRSNVTNAANYVTVAKYFTAGAAIAGRAYGNADSGFTGAGSTTLGTGAFVVTDGAVNRFAPVDSTTPATGASGMTADEVRQVIRQAIGVANQARAQIRRPLGSPAQVTIAVVDAAGNVLGMARTPDAPVFGTDVSLQKARTAALFSGATTGANISALPSITYRDDGLIASAITVNFANYVTASSTFGTTAFIGTHAFTSRAIGNFARPLFPDGIDGTGNGPLSKSNAIWSPFNTGLQLDMVYSGFTGAIVADDAADAGITQCSPLARNGIQIFPGGVPIYRGGTLIGAVGVSGDGVDQDDMIAFLGLSRASAALSSGLGQAPSGIRADTLAPGGTNLRYVQCPQSPFINSSAQNVCSGL